MLITKIYLAAMSRADIPERVLKTLPNFYLYVDEFQSFANESFADILSEARKYKLNLTIAHQYIEQMSEEVRAAVFGNVGTMIAFRVGAFDAEVLEKEFAPQFTAEDLVNLGIYQMYLKLMIDGVSSSPFSASSILMFKDPAITYVPEVIEASRKQFARPRADVEKTIKDWHEAGKVSSSKPPEKQNFERKDFQRERPAQPKREAPKFFERTAKEPQPEKVLVQDERKFKEKAKRIELPPIETEEDEEFVPLKDFSKKVAKENEEVKQKEDKRQKAKLMSKENLAGLKSALAAALSHANAPTEEAAEPKQEEKKEQRPVHHAAHEIPENDLKKVLGIE
jgi:hypothetical protein